MPVLQVNGGRISYQRCGNGPPVLLIQGVGVVGEGWRPQIQGLRDRFDLVTFDNRGIGGSSTAARGLSIEAMAEDALAVMNAEKIERFHVVGHSMGGLIAQELALRTPHRVRSLAILCSFAHGAEGARLTPSLLLSALRMRIGTRTMRRRAFLEIVMPPEYLASVDQAWLAEQLRPLFGRDLADQPPILFRQVRAMARYDAFARLATLQVPSLILCATHDRIARPAYSRALAAAIPRAKLVEVPDAGHGVTIQRSRDVNEILAAHLTAAENPKTPEPQNPEPRTLEP